jgi:RNA polymerase sigma-70 factor (ECF subfamily)
MLSAVEDDASVLTAALPREVRERYAEDLEAHIERWLRQGRQRWPSVTLDARRFVEHVGQRLPADADLDRVRASDQYLVCACLQGDAVALRSLAGAEHVADEVRSRLRQSMLVGVPPRGPALSEYGGRGDLWSWFRVSAVRAALRLQDRDRRDVAIERQILDVLAGVPAEDPELDLLRDTFRDAFRESFVAAFADLEAAQRTMLLQHYVDGLTTEQLGGLHRVHRVTISRRLVRARQSLLESTRVAMMKRLQLSPSECDSIIRVVRSQLDITLERMVGR